MIKTDNEKENTRYEPDEIERKPLMLHPGFKRKYVSVWVYPESRKKKNES